MPAILEDRSQTIDFQKASQMAISTYCILWTIWLCKTKIASRGVIYWLPSFDDVKDFVNGKVDPLFEDNDVLSRGLSSHKSSGGWGKDDTWNIGMKKLFGVETYWRGLKSKSKVKSISADADIFDELDESDMSQVRQAEKRTDASDVKLRRRLSVPTIPDFGINSHFKKTDQCHFAFKCERCPEWNVLEEYFPACLSMGKDGHYYHACRNCKGKLDITKGKWVTKHRSPHRGYQISQLYSPWKKPDDIMAEYHTTEFMGHFYSHVLGLPYLSATDRVEAEQVLALCNPARPMMSLSQTHCVMGIDQGAKLHCVVLATGKPYRLVWCGELQEFEQVDLVMKKYNVKNLVIDALPETRKARELMMRNSRKVWLCFYNDNQKGSYAWREDERIVSVNRTESLDVGTNCILNCELQLPRRDIVIEEFARHCSAIVKTVDEDKETRSKKYIYKALAADHYRHALNYAQIAHSHSGNIKPISHFRLG